MKVCYVFFLLLLSFSRLTLAANDASSTPICARFLTAFGTTSPDDLLGALMHAMDTQTPETVRFFTEVVTELDPSSDFMRNSLTKLIEHPSASTDLIKSIIDAHGHELRGRMYDIQRRAKNANRADLDKYLQEKFGVKDGSLFIGEYSVAELARSLKRLYIGKPYNRRKFFTEFADSRGPIATQDPKEILREIDRALDKGEMRFAEFLFERTNVLNRHPDIVNAKTDTHLNVFDDVPRMIFS